MPRQIEQTKSNAQKAKEYAKANKLSFDATYHLMLLANAADGRASTGIDPNAPAVENLSAEDSAALAAARTALAI